MEPIKVLDDLLEKIDGILQKSKTVPNDNEFATEFLGNYAREMFDLIVARSHTITREQFEYYHCKGNEIIERYGKWN